MIFDNLMQNNIDIIENFLPAIFTYNLSFHLPAILTLIVVQGKNNPG